MLGGWVPIMKMNFPCWRGEDGGLVSMAWIWVGLVAAMSREVRRRGLRGMVGGGVRDGVDSRT